jgi:hypothetical protein
MEERKSLDDDALEGEGFLDHAAEEGEDAPDEEAHHRHATAAGSSNRRTLWLILATASTLMGRKVLTGGFRM